MNSLKRGAAGGGHGRPLGVFMIEFIIIHMCLFHCLRRQLEEHEQQRNEQVDLQINHFTSNSSAIEQQVDERRHATTTNAAAAPMRRLMKLKLLAQIIYKIYFWLYIIELARFLLVELLNWELLSDYQLLDCFLLGRFRFIGRTNKISGRIVVLFTFVLGSYRMLAFQFEPDFKYFAFEFLMYPYDEVLANERAHELRQLARRDKNTSRCTCKINGNFNNNQQQQQQVSISSDLPDFNYDPALYLRSPFKAFNGDCNDPVRYPEVRRFQATGNACCCQTTQHLDTWILRPNRTAASWCTLIRCCEFMVLATLGGTLVWSCLIGYTIGGSILSELGFELAYPACVGWLQRAQHQATALPGAGGSINCSSVCPLPYSSLYVAPSRLAHQMDIDDIPAIISIQEVLDSDRLKLNSNSSNILYDTARIFTDVLENNLWYVDFIVICTSITSLFAIHSLDIILNAREVKRRLEALIVEMTNSRYDSNLRSTNPRIKIQSTWQVSWGSVNEHHCSTETNQYVQQPQVNGTYCDSNYDDDQAKRLALERSEQLTSLQAILIDHFKLVRGYNSFVSYAMSLILSAWFAYSAVLSSWMASVKSKTLEFEFLVTEIGGTIIAVYFFSLAAIVRSQNHQLYAQVARAMALDADRSITKLRWTTIMKFYSPKSMYCFTLMGSTEISWLFCLQFVWWVVSAYIVLTNFLYMNKL